MQALSDARADAEAVNARMLEAEQKSAPARLAARRKAVVLTNEVVRLRRKAETISNQLDITHGVSTAL